MSLKSVYNAQRFAGGWIGGGRVLAALLLLTAFLALPAMAWAQDRPTIPCLIHCGTGGCTAAPAPAGAVCADDTVYNTLPTCAQPNVFTQVSTPAQLQAWQANPTTSLEIKAGINFNGASIALLTLCDVKLSQKAKLTGLVNFVIFARNIDVYADITLTGNFGLRAQSQATIRQASKVSGAAALVLQAPFVDDYGDVSVNSLYYIEGDAVVVHQASRQMSGGAVVILGASVELYGDFHQPASVEVVSATDLIFHQASKIDNAGDVRFEAGSTIDFYGDFINIPFHYDKQGIRLVPADRGGHRYE